MFEILWEKENEKRTIHFKPNRMDKKCYSNVNVPCHAEKPSNIN